MGIIVKLGQCIKTKKEQRRNKISQEVLTGLPLTPPTSNDKGGTDNWGLLGKH